MFITLLLYQNFISHAILRLMQTVFFHIQNTDDTLAREHFMSIVLGSYITKNHKVCVLCENQTHAELLSKHIWSFPKNAFSPHVLKDNMLISEGVFSKKIVLNMSKEPVLHIKTNIIEIVSNSEAIKEEARVRFKIYKSNGFNLEHIKENSF